MNTSNFTKNLIILAIADKSLGNNDSIIVNTVTKNVLNIQDELKKALTNYKQTTCFKNLKTVYIKQIPSLLQKQKDAKCLTEKYILKFFSKNPKENYSLLQKIIKKDDIAEIVHIFTPVNINNTSNKNNDCFINYKVNKDLLGGIAILKNGIYTDKSWLAKINI